MTELFTPGERQHIRKALVTAIRAERGNAKNARHFKDEPAEMLAIKQAAIYSGLISKIDDASK